MASPTGPRANSTRAPSGVQSENGTVPSGFSGLNCVPYSAAPLGDLAEQRAVLANVDLKPLIEAVSKPLGLVGPRQSERAPIVRAHFLAFIYPSKIESVSALHRTLMNNPALRDAAGFSGMPPSRSTLSRAFRDMARFPELVERATADLVKALKTILPDLGREIAIDSTPVKSNSNPNFDPPSDPDAVWIRHDKAGAKGGLEWEWGHRLQIAVDANHNIPLWIKLSRRNNDSPQLIPLFEDMEANVGEFDTNAVLADRGYDSSDNCVYLYERGIEPVIHKRKPKKDKKTGIRLHRGGYNTNGVPTCDCGVAMDFIGETDDGRYLYRCSSVGDGDVAEQARDFQEIRKVCAGKYGDAGVACREDATVDPKTNVWLFGGRLRRMGPEWKRLYRKRWSAERVIGLWKGAGSLNAHRFRDRLAIALHTRLQALAHLATALTALKGAPS